LGGKVLDQKPLEISANGGTPSGRSEKSMELKSPTRRADENKKVSGALSGDSGSETAVRRPSWRRRQLVWVWTGSGTNPRN
ncbi:hypothetical protein Ancab_025596, partial [Ancistrocladus abbreviatus]